MLAKMNKKIYLILVEPLLLQGFIRFSFSFLFTARTGVEISNGVE
jgi:hypothetical protein